MELWPAIAEERASLLETCESLTPGQWATPSLCGEWTVRQVLGHLVVAADPRMRHFVVPLAKAGGSFDKANARLAIAEAERPPDELIARYRERVGNRMSPPGFGPEAPLGDIMLHSLDVRVPLGVDAERPGDRYAVVLDVLFSPKGRRGFVPKGRPELQWVATDHTWSHGTGAEVRGTVADLALAASGRGARLDALGGDGVLALRSWLAR